MNFIEVKGIFFDLYQKKDCISYTDTHYYSKNVNRKEYKNIPYTKGITLDPTDYCLKTFTQEKYNEIITDLEYESWFNEIKYKFVNIENLTLFSQKLDQYMRQRKDEV